MGLKDIILDTLFPPFCFGCQRYHKDFLCQSCWQKIEINTSLFCSICQRRLADNKKVCHQQEGYRLASAVDYKNEIVQKLIQDLKYNFLTSAMEPIKKIIDGYLNTIFFENCPPADLSAKALAPAEVPFRGARTGKMKIKNFSVVPIPLSQQRFRERGFNQAELIAKHLSERLRLPLYQSLISRIKNNPKQSEAKNWEERVKNIEGCFQVAQPELIRGKKIILVDDVFTSGATMNGVVKLLRQNGAREILSFVLARAR